MIDILFVCYQHGCKGERLSYKISQHPHFEKLYKKEVKNRTVIVNDFYRKKFLNSWFPNLNKIVLPKTNSVVPSHYFVDRLKKYFPNAFYVSIECPRDLKKFRKELFDRFYNYTAIDLKEVTGECKNKYRLYNPTASNDEIKKFTYQILKNKNYNFGDIKCLAQGLDPTKENKLKVLNQQTCTNLSNYIKENSYVIAYEDVDSVDAIDIIDYIKKCKGSL